MIFCQVSCLLRRVLTSAGCLLFQLLCCSSIQLSLNFSAVLKSPRNIPSAHSNCAEVSCSFTLTGFRPISSLHRLYMYSKDFANYFFMLSHLTQSATRDQEDIFKSISNFTILKSSKHMPAAGMWKFLWKGRTDQDAFPSHSYVCSRPFPPFLRDPRFTFTCYFTYTPH